MRAARGEVCCQQQERAQASHQKPNQEESGSQRPLHVAQVSFHLDPQGRKAAEILRAWPSLSDVAGAAASTGTKVTVIQACSETVTILDGGVVFHFVAPEPGRFVLSRGPAFRRLIAGLRLDAFHVHSLGFPWEVLSLAQRVPGVPILLQDHADRVPAIWKRPLSRAALAKVAGVAFCAAAQASPWRRAGLLGPGTSVYQVPESSSHFACGDRERARKVTGICGDPAILWVGRLTCNKDPLTVLDGFSLAAPRLRDPTLYCCFADAPLLAAVRRRIADEPMLAGRVHLLGRVPHAAVERLMQAADLFVSASHREGSGYALLEALACGLMPVVTSIPSFVTLTRAGIVGELWPCGDSRKLCTALIAAAARLKPDTRVTVRAHFDRELSFNAVGRKLGDIYADLARSRRRQAAL